MDVNSRMRGARVRDGHSKELTPVTYWLSDIVRPNLAPATAANYDMFARHYIIPYLGRRRLDKLTVQDVQKWLNTIREQCQCCAQEKDKRRKNPKCCAVGKCCHTKASERTTRDAWAALRTALGNAVREEILSRNVAGLVRVSKARSRRPKPWSVEEARQFLESARQDGDPFYAAYVMILVLGLRRGEVLGLAWEDVDMTEAEIHIAWQLQRVAGRLLRRETKTEASEAPLPLPRSAYGTEGLAGAADRPAGRCGPRMARFRARGDHPLRDGG